MKDVPIDSRAGRLTIWIASGLVWALVFRFVLSSQFLGWPADNWGSSLADLGFLTALVAFLDSRKWEHRKTQYQGMTLVEAVESAVLESAKVSAIGAIIAGVLIYTFSGLLS